LSIVRSEIFTVVSVDGDSVKLVPFTSSCAFHTLSSESLEDGREQEPEDIRTISLSRVKLVELNRGKAGALNYCNEYIRLKRMGWAAEKRWSSDIQTFVGIVDARHALVEPNVFWNDALPFFSSTVVKDQIAPARAFGFGANHRYPVCITVQYPQYFSNVSHDDFLDNGNIGYYNLWQVLRDMGKCVTSSGTNTIW
jgi:hypothetical protein